MPSIWDLLPTSAWPVQPVVWPPDPMQLPPGAPQAPTQPFGWAATSANPTNAPTFGWAAAQPAPASAPAYSGVTDPAAFLGSSPGAAILDPARSARLLKDAQRAHAFATWWFGRPSRRPAQQDRDGADRPDDVAASDALLRRNATASADARSASAGDALEPVSAMDPAAPRASLTDQWDAPLGDADTAPNQVGAAQPPAFAAATGNPNIERQGARVRAAAARWGINAPGAPLLPYRVADRVGENFRDAFATPIGPGPEYRAAVHPFVTWRGRISPLNYTALITAPELADFATRALRASYDSAIDAGTEGLVSLGSSRSGSERLGRDLKAMPEAFAGSPGLLRRPVVRAPAQVARTREPPLGPPRPPPVEPLVRDLEPQPASVLDNANYSQNWYKEKFSEDGPFRNHTINDFRDGLLANDLKPSDLPIEYVVRDGHTLILNTRSSQALERAGIPRWQWKPVNKTGDTRAEDSVTDQLRRNGLTSEGVPEVVTLEQWKRAGNPLWPPKKHR
jgi:hypothetical protein